MSSAVFIAFILAWSLLCCPSAPSAVLPIISTTTMLVGDYICHRAGTFVWYWYVAQAPAQLGACNWGQIIRIDDEDVPQQRRLYEETATSAVTKRKYVKVVDWRMVPMTQGEREALDASVEAENAAMKAGR